MKVVRRRSRYSTIDKPVKFGHAAWQAQSRSKFITDDEVMGEKIPDAALLEDRNRA